MCTAGQQMASKAHCLVLLLQLLVPLFGVVPLRLPVTWSEFLCPRDNSLGHSQSSQQTDLCGMVAEINVQHCQSSMQVSLAILSQSPCPPAL